MVSIPFDLYDVDDVKRFVSAKGINKKKIMSLNRADKSAVIAGSSSEPYSVTLSSCSCFDYSMRGLPCKHMYRLAMELGMEDLLPEFSKEKARAFDESEIIELLQAHWMDGEITTDAYVACVSALEKSAEKAK